MAYDKALVGSVALLLEAIATDCLAEQKKSFQDRATSMPAGCIFPPGLNTSDGQIPIGEAGLKALQELSSVVHASFPHILRFADRDAVFNELGKCVGELLLFLSRDESKVSDWQQAANDLLDAFLAACEALNADITWLVPCFVFDEDQGVAAFDIGPVSFWPRREWLDATAYDIRKDAVIGIWSGTLREEDLRNQAFSAQGRDDGSYLAHAIARLSRNYSWLATITIGAHEQKKSRQKAYVFAELALTALSLFVDQKSAADVFVAGSERLNVSEQYLGFSPDGGLLGEWHFNKPGIGRASGDAQKFVHESEPARTDAGHILSRYLADTTTGTVPFLIDRWVNALHWFGQATREPVDFMAIVKYGCALDVLTGASGSVMEMADYAASATGLSPNAPIGTGPLTLEDALARIYNEGRSELAHGSKNGLFADLSIDRNLAHTMTSTLLRKVLKPLSELVVSNDQMLNEDVVKPRHAIRAFKLRMRGRTAAVN